MVVLEVVGVSVEGEEREEATQEDRSLAEVVMSPVVGATSWAPRVTPKALYMIIPALLNEALILTLVKMAMLTLYQWIVGVSMTATSIRKHFSVFAPVDSNLTLIKWIAFKVCFGYRSNTAILCYLQ